MKAISGIAFTLLFSLGGLLFAQEQPPAPAKVEAPRQIRIKDLETAVITSLRKQFPQLPGMFASIHSCHLPDYGPFVTVTLQLPANYLTRPVLMELERRHRAAEQRARQMRDQIEKAAQVITLRIREAGLVERIEEERGTKKKNKHPIIEQLEKDLLNVRSSIESLETSDIEDDLIQDADSINEVDLNKMMVANYNQLIQRVSDAMKETLVENGPRLGSLDEGERISIHTYIRDNLFGNQGNSILFMLKADDIGGFRRGELDLNELKGRVVVRPDKREQ